MSIAAAAVAEAVIASAAEFDPKTGKTPPKRMTIAKADTALVPEPR